MKAVLEVLQQRAVGHEAIENHECDLLLLFDELRAHIRRHIELKQSVDVSSKLAADRLAILFAWWREVLAQPVDVKDGQFAIAVTIEDAEHESLQLFLDLLSSLLRLLIS